MLGLAAAIVLGAAVAVSFGSSASHPKKHLRRHVQVRPPAKATQSWPTARTTGAIPGLVTRSLPVSGGFFKSDTANLTITNTEIDGGIYWTGGGTLTLRNDIIRPDWTQSWAALAVVGRGNVLIDHVTIAGVNVGAPGQFTKGITIQSSGSVRIGYLNESGICQNDVGAGPTVIHDSYLHDLGSGNGATCHATGIEIQGPTRGPVLIVHNTIDEYPGRQFQAGTDGAVFVQALYGPISGIVVDNNFLHSGYSNIEIAADGRYDVAAPTVTNNCLVWPPGGRPLSAPGIGAARWSGNTKCSLAGEDTGRAVRIR